MSGRIDALRSGWASHTQLVLARNQAYLRAFSPDFDVRIGEHDQWPDPFRQETEDHFRSSYNLTRAVVELWAALEASEFPTVRWTEEFIPTPPPSTDEQEAAAFQMAYRSEKVVARQKATLREQQLFRHIRSSQAGRHYYSAVIRKNTFGHSWLKTWPDMKQRKFRVSTRIDPSTVYPVWSYADDDEGRLDAILVAYRRSAQSVNAQYPGFLHLASDGVTVSEAGYYQPTAERTTDADRRYVWVEDYWVLDDLWDSTQEPGWTGRPLSSRAVNAIRINGALPCRMPDGSWEPNRGDGVPETITAHNGWQSLPYIHFENENLRDRLGFSDAGTMLPIQDSTNRFLSQQQDVIAGEARPRFKYRGDADRQIVLGSEDVIPLDPDEDIEQLQVHLDTFPTQVHGQQLADVMSRATGLPDTVWGRITSAQNSGRALSTAWRAVAARLVPRRLASDRSIRIWLSMWIDWMQIYGWDSAEALYGSNRDFDLDFPNQEPRDFTEITMDALNRLNGGLIDRKGAIEATGQNSPDEVIESIRSDYLDTILYPDKAQAYLLLQKAKQDIEIQAQQAGMQMSAMTQQMQGAGGPPKGPSTEQAAAQASQAQTQAAQQAAPTRNEAMNQAGPATQAGAASNPIKTGTMVQDGQAQNRFIQQGTLGG
ncbi:MAG: hypothetical protein WCP53_09390 [Verrucomicrobiota bacterium]